MSQGSINMPSRPRSSLQDIASALQAVESVFGIPTKIAQAKLESAQQGLTESETKLKEQELGLRAAKESKYQQLMQDLQNEATGQAAQGPVPIATAAKGAPASPLAQVAQQKPFSLQSSKVLQKASLDPMTADYAQTLYKGEQERLGLQKTQQEIGNSAADEARKQRGEVSGLQNDFFDKFPDVKQSMTELNAAKGISKKILSGNPVSASQAKEQLALIGAGITRLSDNALQGVENPGVFRQAIDTITRKTSGQFSPKELNDLHTAAGIIAQNAGDTINSAGDQYSQLKAPSLGMSSQSFKTQKLLPGGVNASLPQTKVKVDPNTKKPFLIYNSAPGKWTEVVGE